MTHIKDKQGVARKPHSCRICSEKIDKGETCHIYTGVESPDGFYTLHFHLDCWDYSKDWNYWDWDIHIPGDIPREEVQRVMKDRFKLIDEENGELQYTGESPIKVQVQYKNRNFKTVELIVGDRIKDIDEIISITQSTD